ncbi:MAG: DUF1273 family protein [Oscillospiraceae bacterium]|nr:DUF1273 family protein [Oscillospiraceae bacterium]
MTDILIDSGITHFLCGGAHGFDLLAAEYILKKRKENQNIKLSMYLPCRDQAAYWPSKRKNIYRSVIDASDEVFYSADKYDVFCMHARNRALIDNSDILVCYLVDDTGGTAYTRNYAEEKGKRIINLADLIGE